MVKRYVFSVSSILVIAALAGLLYIPFLGNALVFDDHTIFTSLVVYDYAQKPFDLLPRTFPYFTLGLVQVLFDSIKAQRAISLTLHILCAGMLYALLTALLRQALTTRSDLANEKQVSMHANILGFIGGVWFAIHPVAVYGAAYLVQRTILFATLFSLLSLWYYCRAFAENRTSDVIVAALLYSAAVFSKEHAVMLPAAAVMLTALYHSDYRSKAKRIGLYLALCMPAAITAVLAAKYVIATGYEPSFGALSSRIYEIPLLQKPWGAWLVSIVMQAGFFFDYFTYWVMPDVHSMSIDMRADIAYLWTTWWLIPKAALFFACPVVSLYFLRQGGLIRLFGCGLFYSWFLFLTELTTIRFQDPFVLYRSYLWAPGYILMGLTICCAFQLRWITGIFIPLLIVYFGLAHNRLESFVSESTVWEDAAAKLKSESVLGSDRIFYNRGLQYIKGKKFNEAIADFSRAIPENPKAYYYYYERGIAYYSLQDFTKAEADFNHAFTLNNKYGPIQYARGMIFEHRGCFNEARSAYSASLNLGTAIARLRLDSLAKKVDANREKKLDSRSDSCTSYATDYR